MLKRPVERRPRLRRRRSDPEQPEITFGWEYFTDCVAEARPLLAREHAEVQDARFPYDPDWDRLFGWAAAGALDIWTTRADDTLIGYASVLFMPHLYSREIQMGCVHTPYLTPEWRLGMLGYEMFETLFEALKQRKVDLVDVDLPEGSRLHKLLSRLGFKVDDVRRRKWL
jgi:hypothetical protein